MNIHRDLEIRVASGRDLETLVRLVGAFRDHLEQATPSDADLRESISLLLKDGQTEFFLARDTEGTAVGYVQCRYRYSAWTSAVEAELEDVFVNRAARRQGVGVQLMEFAMAHATQRECRSIGLNTNERNEGALALYRQFGLVAERALWNGSRQLWLQRRLNPPSDQDSRSDRT